MSYQAEVSRVNPTCFLFLIDQSSSMSDPLMGAPGNPSKAQFVADVLNKTLQALVVTASKDLDIRRYYQVGMIGYGARVASILTGSPAGQDMVWIDDIYKNPLRIDERQKKEPDGAGGVISVSTKFPVWVDAVSNGGTPMGQALENAYAILRDWVQQHPTSYPPVVINLTDGEANDKDPQIPAAELRSLATSDGNVVLLTVHASSNQYASPIFFPDMGEGLPDQASRAMFEMSSPLTERMIASAKELRPAGQVKVGAKAFVYNAGIEEIVQAMDIGTRPSNLR